jgi:hypothetical protein
MTGVSQRRRYGSWGMAFPVPVPPAPDDSALIFCLVHTDRSSGRIPAALHRVVDIPEPDETVVLRRRSHRDLILCSRATRYSSRTSCQRRRITQVHWRVKFGQLRGQIGSQLETPGGSRLRRGRDPGHQQSQNSGMCRKDLHRSLDNINTFRSCVGIRLPII